MLNLFEVPVTLLTPLFRLVFHSFDLNIKKITNEKAIQQQKYVMLLQCHIPERGNVILYQAPVCVSCKMIKMDLVCSHVLKGLDSDLRPLCSFLCQLITPDSRHITHICFCCSVLLIFFLSQSMHHLILFSLHLTLRAFKWTPILTIPPGFYNYPFHFILLSYHFWSLLSLALRTSPYSLTRQSETLCADAASLQRLKPTNAQQILTSQARHA